jgi:hypothetical protein
LNVFALLLISGCTTTPITIDVAKPVPEDRIFSNKYSVMDENKESVAFIRDKGLTGSACANTLYINGNKAFAIQPGEVIIVNLRPGNHLFRLDVGSELCSNESLSQPTFLNIGEPQRFRRSIGSNLKHMLTRIK